MKCCHHCEFRTVGCHSVCQAYAEEKREHDEWASKARKERLKKDDVNGVRIAAVEKFNKKNRRFYK